MNMKRLIESMDKIEECGMTEMPGDMTPAPVDQGNPVTMNISLNASGEKNVTDLLNMMKNAGLKDAEPVTPNMMPVRQDMERLNAIVGEPDDHPDMEPSMGQEEIGADDEAEEAYDNAPDPEYGDHQMMTKDLSGGLNREKKMHKPAAGGDNAMAIEDGEEESYSIRGKSPEAQDELARRANGIDATALESKLKSQLLAALSEKKAKPDFLDVDKDGDKKEPMKKAIKDKGSKPKKGEVPAQFKKKNESALDEISSDMAKRYTKNAKVDRDNTDHILKRDGSTNDWKANQELQKRNAKRTKGMNRAKKRIEK